MHTNHPVAFAGRLLTTAAFSCLVALALTLGGKGRWDTNLAYSLPIGLLSWLTIDLGRLLLTRGHLIPWPRRPWGWVLVAGGTAFGFIAGSAIGRLYSGDPGGPWSGLRGHEALSTLVITIAASVVVSFFFHSLGKARFLQARMAEAQRDAAEARLKLLQTQLEPHMLFNTLANLRVLVRTDPVRSEAMLDHLIAYLRATLEASRTTWHPLADEFDRLADYLALMAVRMGPRLAYHLDLPDALRTTPVPALLLQPLVENAIRHGLEPLVAGGQIHVCARLLQPAAGPASILLSVEDTGAGMAATPARTDAGGSAFGLQQVRERLHTLYGSEAQLQLLPTAPHGTRAELTYPPGAPAPAQACP